MKKIPEIREHTVYIGTSRTDKLILIVDSKEDDFRYKTYYIPYSTFDLSESRYSRSHEEIKRILKSWDSCRIESPLEKILRY